MGVDPLADQFAGWNPYHYVHNNPINMIDPDGRSAVGVDGTDDWILRNGNIEYDASVTSEQDAFNKYGGSATYLGSAGTIEDASGRLNLNENGTSFFLPSPTGGVTSEESGGASDAGSVSSFGGATASFVGDYNVSGGNFRGANGNYFSIEGRGGWNQYTSTKAKMNTRISTAKWASRVTYGLGALNYGLSVNQYQNGELSGAAFGIEMGSTTISTFAPPIVSIPWTIGYEGLGRQGITRFDWYQSLKRNVQGVQGGSDGLISTNR